MGTPSNFYSSSISNLDKFLWGKLFLTSSSFHPYFIWNFWSQLDLPFDQISLNYLKLIQINTKPYYSSRRPTSVPSQVSPRAPARLHVVLALCPMPADRPDPPVSGTASRHCAAAHLLVPPPLSVSCRQRACGTHRSRELRSGRCRAPLTGRG
jgi:hypothetical protein